MNISKFGIAVVLATLGAYAVASLERQHALREERDRMTLEQNAEPLVDMKEITRRVEWGIGRKKLAHDEWRKAIDTGTQADVERANSYGERIEEEIRDQKKRLGCGGREEPSQPRGGEGGAAKGCVGRDT
jgi:hypothetical protein